MTNRDFPEGRVRRAPAILDLHRSFLDPLRLDLDFRLSNLDFQLRALDQNLDFVRAQRLPRGDRWMFLDLLAVFLGSLPLILDFGRGVYRGQIFGGREMSRFRGVSREGDGCPAVFLDLRAGAGGSRSEVCPGQR